MKTLILLLLIVLTSHFPMKAAVDETEITHVVIVWLNETLSEQQVTTIIEKSRVLETLEVVKAVKIGRPVTSNRDVVDDSFTFAISVSFKNAADMKAYSIDETHLNYVKTVLKPSLEKILIYDF